MNNYTPFFNCTHCGNVVQAVMSNITAGQGLQHGYIPLCGCAESTAQLEREHRMKMEARKRAQAQTTRRKRRGR